MREGAGKEADNKKAFAKITKGPSGKYRKPKAALSSSPNHQGDRWFPSLSLSPAPDGSEAADYRL